LKRLSSKKDVKKKSLKEKERRKGQAYRDITGREAQNIVNMLRTSCVWVSMEMKDYTELRMMKDDKNAVCVHSSFWKTHVVSTTLLCTASAVEFGILRVHSSKESARHLFMI
jgi:hypothetical protein